MHGAVASVLLQSDAGPFGPSVALAWRSLAGRKLGGGAPSPRALY